MKKLFTLFTLLLIFGCTSLPSVETPAPDPVQPPFRNEVYLKDKLELYTFEVKNTIFSIFSPTPSSSYGKAFIANGKLWSAAHVFGQRKRGPDCIDLGKVPIKGLTLCKASHKIGDFAYYKTTKRDKIILVIQKIEKYFFLVSLDKNMMNGDSGSPVLCEEHSAVIGLVSEFWANHLNYRRAGHIAFLTENTP